MAEVVNGHIKSGDYANMRDIFERRRALRNAQSSGYDPNKKSESLFGRRIDDFKHFMDKDDLKKLYPHAVISSSSQSLSKLSTACPSDDTGLYMIATAEPTPCTPANDLTTPRSNSLPAFNSSEEQLMDRSGYGSGFSPTCSEFNNNSKTNLFQMESTLSCAAPVSQIPSAHSMSGKGTEFDVVSDSTPSRAKLQRQSTLGLVGEESEVLESEAMINSIPSSNITATYLDMDKLAEEPVVSPNKQSE